jgi:hypothetical protein
VAGMMVVGATDGDMHYGNGKGFHDMDNQVRDWVYQQYRRFSHYHVGVELETALLVECVPL